MSAESPRHARTGGPLTVPSQPPSDRGIIDAVSGFINDVTLSSSSTVDPKDVIQWARFETADINEPTPEGDSENDISPLLLILGYGSGVQVWLIPPSGEAQEVLSWRQGTVRVLRILPTPQHGDCFASKRPLIALCDSASPGPSFCSLSFISIRGGEQVKSIKFKNPILDVLANKRSVVVSFSERFAVFDAATLEDRMAVTTCYPCPCPLGGSLPINPLALGDRWLAYADKKLNQSKRSSGGCEGEGVTSYTATVLHAAKTLSKGLRGLGETVAHSLSGGRSTSQSPSPPNADIQQPGVVTIIDIEGTEEEDGQDAEEPCDPIVAHFVAHSEAIIALKFDPSGMLLVTADRRGHDFHVFRINPHPCGPSLAAVHHLYILHRGDTTAKVQDIAISGDSRWAAVSTLRGTTHVFALSPYGGACGVRTHTQPRVVNRLSRFHRSAGLPIHTAAAKRASGSPVGDGMSQGAWFPNPRLPPYPMPTTASPLAQLRPTANIPTHTITRTSSGRQRLSSLSEDSNAAPLLARARFGLAACPSPASVPAGLVRAPAAPVAALYLMAANGSLLHLLLHPRPLSSVPKEKICDDSPIELEVESVAQWPLQRPAAAADLLAPLPPSNPLLQQCSRYAAQFRGTDMCMSEEERWLSQVEIVTHAGPHRRLWMGPQFVFKTYNCTGSNSSLSEAETVEVDTSGVARSNPVNMPGVRPVVPVLVDSGSASSLEHSPSDSFRRKSLLADAGRAPSVCDVQLREDLAEAMKEDHGAARQESGGPRRERGGGVARAVDPLGTVVQPAPTLPPALDPDPELYVTSNADEATFRPVVRAPAPLPARPEAAARSLPHTTTIPVQNAPATGAPPTPPEPLPLSTAVVIPAALTAWPRETASDDPSFNLDKNFDECERKDARSIEKVREKRSAHAERIDRDRDGPTESLPGSNRPSGDIQPTVRPRVKRSPTPKSDSVRASDVSSKDKKSRVKPSPKVEDESSKSLKIRKEPEIEKVEMVEIVKTDPEVLIAVVEPQEEAYTVLTREKLPAVVTRENTPPVVTREKKTTFVTRERTPVLTLEKGPSVVALDKTTPVVTSEKTPPVVTLEKTSVVSRDKTPPTATQEKNIPIISKIKTPPVVIPEKTPVLSSVPLKVSIKETTELKSSKKKLESDIKTEEQAWDMLLHEPEKPVVYNIQSIVTDKSSEEPKPKSKKKGKAKKSQEDSQAKAEEDTFIEIHAIEEKQQPSSGELVSISSPYTDLEPISYSAKTKKSRSSKSATPERIDVKCDRKDQFSVSFEKNEKFSVSSERKDSSVVSCEVVAKISSAYKTKERLKVSSEETGKFNVVDVKDQLSIATESKEHFDDKDIWIIDEPELTKPIKTSKKGNNNQSKTDKEPEKPIEIEKSKVDTLKVSSDVTENAIVKEQHKTKKGKSLSPYSERKSVEKRQETEVTDVYVIDTVKEDYPEIQITKGSKMRKRSPQPAKKVEEKEIEVVEKPVKSWSSIAASKSVKKEEKVTEERVIVEKKSDNIEKRASEQRQDSGEKAATSTQVSLQDKLIELCKRTDIMVAECDAPSESSELNFIEEHHSVLDLPPLEPLDFGLDDFKLEVMRDSLLDVNDTTSPICKININSILSTIKETTSKAIESSAFNLIDLEKVPSKREKGFSVVENDNIKTGELKIDEERDDKDVEVMEKSSDDDITSPVVSTDSDKDDKKTGASNVTTPSSKQSSKSKKSRKRKK